MCVFNWAVFGTVLSGIGSIVSAGLAIWLVRVTIRYVRVNADILATTREALQINAGLLEANRNVLRIMRQQLASDRLERSGPVAAAIQDRLSFLHRWHTWLAEPQAHYGQIVNLSHEFLTAEFEASRLASSKLSLTVYNELSSARKGIEMFASLINDVQQRAKISAITRHDGVNEQIASAVSGREFVDEAIMHLEKAYSTLGYGADEE
jgi:hypothetical protein